jgi:predicted dehydrogenase
MSKFAVVGAGNWGRNIIRTMYQLLGEDLKYVCDLDEDSLGRIKSTYPTITTTNKFEDLLADDSVTGISIATSAPTHFKLAKLALESGKHVYVEKPMTLNVDDAKELVALSDKTGKAVMVGHILVYHPAVRKLQQLIADGELGDIYYLYSQRLNLGKVRADENAMWSFAPHDISVIFYLVGQELESISASGQSFLREGVEDVVFVNMRFKSGQIANIHLSWLDPHKRRMLTIVGNKKMVVFDDTESQEKLKIYDKGVERADDYNTYGEYLSLRFGDILIPKIDTQEPLKLTCQTFIRATQGESESLSSAREGLKVVEALNAAQESLKNGGTPVKLS